MKATLAMPLPLVTAVKSAIPVNGLLVPFKQAVQSIARFCRPLVIYNEGTDFELSLPGSAFAVRVGGRNYLLATLHQLGKGEQARKPAEVVILDRRVKPTAAIPGREAAIERTLDYFALEFRETANGRDLNPLFCRVDLDQVFDASDAPEGTTVLQFFAIGFPSGNQGYDSAWDDQTESSSVSVTSRWTSVFLAPVDRSVWDDDHLQPYVMSPETAASLGDPDGLSGSPVFMIYQDKFAAAHIALAGIIQKGNTAGRVNVLPSFYLREVFKLASVSAPQ